MRKIERQRNFHSAQKTLAIARVLEAPPRLELGVRVLQTRALPLGYGAVFLPGAALCGRLSGAGDGIRTRDFHLGKVTLYH